MLVELLYPYYLRKPIPEFYEMIHDKLLPSLREIEDKLGGQSAEQENELKKVLPAATKKIMGR